MCESGEIKKLDEAVINRIAAGEVIQRPANALKELIENSIDAKSTNIQIICKNGGLKLLQILDNGTGIRKSDFDIVCERFTTSKLRTFEDLHSIATYGFRGEALASMSHVAHLTIVSKTYNEKCAYTASYEDSKLKAPPKPSAGNQGTQISVEDLFYNMNVRKRALRSPAEEYQKICDVVGKYAIHNSKIGFALKKHGSSNDIRTPPNSTVKDNIQSMYGASIARELVEFELKNEKFKFTAAGHITNVNYSSKKFLFVLFINHRLVDCQSLRKCLDQVYTTYLPKNTHPFIYLSLQLDPKNIDVNVHPTKHQVHFLNEDSIVELITKEVDSKLLGSNNSRMFYTQSKIPVVFETIETLKNTDKKSNVYDKDFVRTDATEQKLEKFFGAPVKKNTNQDKINNLDESINNEDETMDNEMVKQTEDFENRILEKSIVEESKSSPVVATQSSILQYHSPVATTRKNLIVKGNTSKMPRQDTELTSVLELRLEIENNCHMGMRQLFSQLVFVGAISTNQALIQHSTKLYLCNTKMLLEELLYQFMLYNFQNLNLLQFSEKLAIEELAMQALELPESGWTEEDGDKEALAKRTLELLQEQSEMLEDYFNIKIDAEGNLCALPQLIDNYSPSMSGLPMYMLRLATEVSFEDEKECFKGLCRETALYYSQMDNDQSESWKWLTEYVVYPAFKDYLLPPKSLTDTTALLQLADLPNLYKVFERC